MCQALVGNYREEHVFALTQALELFDVYQTKVMACDQQIQAILTRLKQTAPPPANKLLPIRRRTRQPNAPTFDARAALHAILGVDLTRIDGLGPYLALKLVGECGTALTAWPSAKHFTSWLALAPHNKISGGKVLSSKTRRTSNRAASLLRLAAGTVGRTDTALGAFYRRLSARVGKAKAITGHRAQDRRSVLQHAPAWHDLRRSRGVLLRRPLQAAGSGQPSTTREVVRIRSAGSGCGRGASGCFLGNRSRPRAGPSRRGTTARAMAAIPRPY